jgi:UDP-glucose 4-epimerase
LTTTESNSLDNGYMGIRAAVLGASGFIGRWVARLLCAGGADVSLVVRDEATARGIFRQYDIVGRVLERDLRNAKVVYQLFQELRPTITFNLVGYGVDRSERDEDLSFQINAHLVSAVCKAIAEIREPEWTGQDLVHVGSALEYGATGGNLDEGSVTKPATLYGRSKAEGTRALTRCCQSCGVKGLTARLFTVYGPGEHPGRLLPSLLEAAREQKRLEMTAGTQMRDFTYVEDVADGLLRLGLATAYPGEIVNLATGRLTSVRRFAETAAKILCIPGDRLVFGSLPTRSEEMRHDPVTVERLRRSTGWVPPTNVAEGVRKTKEFAEFDDGRCD